MEQVNVMCPLIGELISDDDCFEVCIVAEGEIKERVLNEKYRAKENWREICMNCTNHID
ncbi:MAG: hypothetical protein PHN26_05885 [Eubacteriaceae bacterium]|nr:hypothetical protein [Eubacteriaceae bacterium]